MRKLQILNFMFKLSLYLTVFILAISACKQSPTAQQRPPEADAQVELPKDFTPFYEKFLTDSLYQIAHITWPLQGIKTIQQDSVTPGVSDTQWTLEEWRMHRLDLVNSGEFKRSFKVIGDFMVQEQIRAISVPFGIERRYARQANGEWELIYYASVHEFKE